VTNSTISEHHSSRRRGSSGRDKMALVGLGVQAGKSIVSPHTLLLLLLLSLLAQRLKRTR
jgi:hypothetical protein